MKDQPINSGDEALEALESEAEPLEGEDEENRPERRSDADDPWHGLNDFDDE